MTNHSAYPADVFIGNTLNFFKLSINGYPVSFILWNILLAVLAILVARWSARILLSNQRWLAKLGAVLLWLALLPNAAYIMTDARHIIGYCPLYSYGKVCLDNAWMTLFFFAFGAIGWPAFVFALRPMKRAVSKYFNKRYDIAFIVLACFFSAWGLLLGLVDRFNSWNLITNPWQVLQSAWNYLSEPIAIFNLVMTFLLLLVLYTVGEKIFIKSNLE